MLHRRWDYIYVETKQYYPKRHKSLLSGRGFDRLRDYQDKSPSWWLNYRLCTIPLRIKLFGD